jgi:hypothetical protein
VNRFVIPLCALALLLLFIGLEQWAPGVYFAVLAALDIPKVVEPFSDLSAVLQAVHCAGQGVNVYAHNQCMGGGMYNYSPLLLRFSWAGGLALHVGLAGVGLALLFIMALVALPAPEERFGFWVRLPASLSASVIFVLERANLDAVIFILAVCGVLLWLRGAVLRLAGYALFCAAAALKFYPVALLVLALRERPWRLMVLAAVGLLAVAGFMLRFGAGTLAALAVVPHGPPFGNCFGAIDIPLGISLGLAALHGNPLTHLAHFHMPPALRFAYGAMILAAFWRAMANRALYRDALNALDPARLAFLIAGAALACACFFMAQNILYRAVFLLLALPGMCALTASLPKARSLAVFIVLLMWESLFRIGTLAILLPVAGPALAYAAVIMVWLGRELIWWWVVTQFLAILLLQAGAAWQNCRAALARRVVSAS